MGVGQAPHPAGSRLWSVSLASGLFHLTGLDPFAKLQSEVAQGKEPPSQDKGPQPAGQPPVIC